jgi:hypothetical protein
MRQMAELQQLQRKVIDLELKVKTLENTLAEKNTMVSRTSNKIFVIIVRRRKTLTTVLPVHVFMIASGNRTCVSKS